MLAWSKKKNDLTIEFARKHYDAWGFFEGRHRYCADKITDIQAKCYLQNYADLQKKYGENWELARQHWYHIGYKQQRDYHCQLYANQQSDLFLPKRIKTQGEVGKFRCNGDIHYTRISAKTATKPDGEPDSWDLVKNFDFYTIRSDGLKEFECNNDNLNSRSFQYTKQCFCELKPRNKPRFCAKEGQQCRRCNGQIIYGRAFDKKTQGNPKRRLTID